MKRIETEATKEEAADPENLTAKTWILESGQWRRVKGQWRKKDWQWLKGPKIE